MAPMPLPLYIEPKCEISLFLNSKKKERQILNLTNYNWLLFNREPKLANYIYKNLKTFKNIS
jgi:hypothetical protein